MAFGKPPESKGTKVSPTIEDQLWKASIQSEDIAAEAWQTKWGWILTEYELLQNNMQEATKDSVLTKVVKKSTEKRSIKPIPETVSHECGWLASRSEFKLEKFGPDVYKSLPLYKLSNNFFEK